MAQVTVTAQYVADTAAYVRNVRQAADATNQFARELPQVAQAQDAVKTSTVALGSALGVLGAQVFARATGAVMKYAQQGIAAAKQYEQTVISIEGIFAGTGMSMEAAAEKTKTYLADLRDFAAKTPFELPQTLDAVKRLLSIGYAADDVKNRLLPTIGDIVSALGQPPHAISAVVYAFGQMKSAGRVLSQDLMQIGNALPGFNAKMAIANEMFQGDFGAMTKAMESGALKSEEAIDVIITAMQKFGGASGAMERQSKTLSGVMSTFADTINNALIDGLLPSLPKLSATLNEVMPAVEDMATAFAQALGPALIQGADVMGQMAPTLSAVIPPIIEMVSQLTVMADVVIALSPMLELMANVVGSLATVLGMLPSPIYAAIGALLLMRMAMKKLGLEALMAAKGVSLSWASMAANAKIAAGAILVSFTSMRVGLEMAQMGAARFAAGFAAAMRAAGVAVKGLLASFGPVGWIIMAAAAAFEIFAGKSMAAKARTDEMSASLDVLTGKLNEAGKASLTKTLLGEIDRADWQVLDEFGVGLDEALAAIQGGEVTMTAFIDKVNENGAALRRLGIDTGAVTNNVYDWGSALQTATADAEYARQVTENTARAAYSAASAYSVQNQEYYSAADAYRGMTSTASQYSAAQQETYLKTQSLTFATEAAKDAVTALDDATKALSEALSAEASYDKARQGILNLSKELKDGDKTLKGYSQAALDNRAAIRDAAQGYIEYANSLKDPVERQKALEEGERRIRKAVKEAGLDPKDSDIIRLFKEQADASKRTVDEFAEQRDVAAKYGNEVGVNFIDGIIKQLEAGKKDVNAAAAMAVSGMPDSANAVLDASSPSRAAMKVAKNFVDGVVAGVKANAKLANMEVSKLGEGMLQALQDKLDDFASKMETAASAVINLDDLTVGVEGKFGLPSQIQESFGEGANFSGILGGYKQLSQSVQEMFAPLLDEEIVPANVVRRNERMMNQAMSDLDRYTQFAVDKVKEREAAQQKMRDLDRAYQAQTAEINSRYAALERAAADEARAVEKTFAARQGEINSRYNALDAAAQANIKRIENHYKTLIPTLEAALQQANAAYERENKVLQDLISTRDNFLSGIQKGFRGFLNALKVDGDKASRTITRTTEQIVDGIKVLTSEAFTETTGGGGFADALQSRLKSLRDFTNNIRALLSRGLDPQLVQDFVGAGVESAGETVAALAAGSDDQIAQVNSAQAELSGLITQFTTESSAAWFDYGIAQQQAIVTPLQAAATAAQLALAQAQLARDTELAAAQAQAEALRLNRAAELAAAQADRDAELERIRAYQEQLRVDRESELLKAAEDYDAAKKQIEKEVDEIEKALAANAQTINTTFINLRTKLLPIMKRFGGQIINGLISGLESREGALYAKADAIADGIRARIAAAFAFGSPSRVTRTMGEQIAQGLIVGMNSELRNVERAADALAMAVMAPLSMPDLAAIGGAPSVSAMTGAGAGFGGGPSSIAITVNAGMGTDGAELGRQVVEAIRKYERRSGPVFVSA